MSESSDNSNKRSIGMWFRSLRRTSRVILIVAVIASVALVAYAASVLFNTAHQSTNLSKERYITVQLSGAEATGTIKPGDPVALSPVLTNNGSVNATAIIRVSMPTVNGSPAYEYTLGSGWTEIESDPTAGEYVYGYGTSDELSIVAPGGSTDPLVENGFTMRSDITGAEFNGMSDVDNQYDRLHDRCKRRQRGWDGSWNSVGDAGAIKKGKLPWMD